VLSDTWHFLQLTPPPLGRGHVQSGSTSRARDALSEHPPVDIVLKHGHPHSTLEIMLSIYTVYMLITFCGALADTDPLHSAVGYSTRPCASRSEAADGPGSQALALRARGLLT
jgi:hypothetical protein